MREPRCLAAAAAWMAASYLEAKAARGEGEAHPPVRDIVHQRPVLGDAQGIVQRHQKGRD